MKVLWNKSIGVTDLWIPECYGLFCKQEKKVTYFFMHGSALLAVSEEDSEPRLIHYSDDLPLPNEWCVVETTTDAYLLVSADSGVNLNSNEFTCDIPSHIQREYSHHFRPEKYYVEAPQCLGEYTVLHKGNWGYVCQKESSKLWEFTGRAYLYTDFVLWKDRLFFGTGGQGGYFYLLDIHSGKPLAAINTGGTRCIVHEDNLCYFLANDKRARFFCVDLNDGKTVSQCDLPGKANLDSRVTKIGDRIHVITFTPPQSKSEGFIWSCIEI